MTTSTSATTTRPLPPLTTLWVQPTNCQLTLHTSASSKLEALQDKRCYPKDHRKGEGSFSPGLCPHSFTQVTTTTLNSTTTRAVCCPTGASYAKVDGEDGCKWQTLTGPTTVLSSKKNTNTTRTISANTVTLIQSPIFVLWQETDLPILAIAELSRMLVTSTPSVGPLPPFKPKKTSSKAPQSPKPSPRSYTTEVSETATPTIPAAATDAPGVVVSANSGLSVAAKTGIGVGVSLGFVLVLLGIGVWCWRRRGVRRKEEPAELWSPVTSMS